MAAGEYLTMKMTTRIWVAIFADGDLNVGVGVPDDPAAQRHPSADLEKAAHFRRDVEDAVPYKTERSSRKISKNLLTIPKYMLK